MATQRLLQAIDNALYVLTGHGLEQFATLGTKVSFLTPEMQAQVADCMSGPMKSLAHVPLVMSAYTCMTVAFLAQNILEHSSHNESRRFLFF